MDQVVGIGTLITSLALLWSGRRRLEVSSFAATFLSVLELLGIATLLLSLGWWGLVVLSVVNLLAVLVWSVVLALRVEEKLVYAATQSGESKETMKALAKKLNARQELKALGPVEKAELIKLLAERARSASEIETMAVPIGMLKLIHHSSIEWLVERFDRLMRVAGEPADKAMGVADTITTATQRAAAPFAEIVDGLLIAYGGESLDAVAA